MPGMRVTRRTKLRVQNKTRRAMRTQRSISSRAKAGTRGMTRRKSQSRKPPRNGNATRKPILASRRKLQSPRKSRLTHRRRSLRRTANPRSRRQLWSRKTTQRAIPLKRRKRTPMESRKHLRHQRRRRRGTKRMTVMMVSLFFLTFAPFSYTTPSLAKVASDPQAIKVREWRHRLQKVFLANKAAHKPEVYFSLCAFSCLLNVIKDVKTADELFKVVEAYDGMTIEQLQVFIFYSSFATTY